MNMTRATTWGWMLILFCVASASAFAQDAALTRIASQSRGAIVRIVVEGTNKDGDPKTETGTGFFITRDGYLLTAAHVVGQIDDWLKDQATQAPLRKVSISGVNAAGQNVSYSTPAVIVSDPQLGFALLRAPGDQYQFLKVSVDHELADGEGVYAMGFANASGPEPMAGDIARSFDVDYGGAMRVSRLNARRGDSGGPVFAPDGSVIGLIDGLRVFAGTTVAFPLARAVNLLRLAMPSRESRVVPSGMIAAFDLNECPVDWDPYSEAVGRVLVGAGSVAGLTVRRVGAEGGAETVTLNVEQLPRHQHQTVETGDPTNSKFGIGIAMHSRTGVNWTDQFGASLTGFAGDGKPHENMPPFRVVTFCKRR